MDIPNSNLHPQPELDTCEVQTSQLQPSHPQDMLQRSAIAVQSDEPYEVQYLQTIRDSPALDGIHSLSDLDTYEVQYPQPMPRPLLVPGYPMAQQPYPPE